MKKYSIIAIIIAGMCLGLTGCPESDDDREIYTTVRGVDEMEGIWSKTSYIRGKEYDVAFFQITEDADYIEYDYDRDENNPTGKDCYRIIKEGVVLLVNEDSDLFKVRISSTEEWFFKAIESNKAGLIISRCDENGEEIEGSEITYPPSSKQEVPYSKTCD